MVKINSFQELKTLSEKSKALLANRSREDGKKDTDDKTIDIMVCGGTGCQASGGIEVVKVLEEERDVAGLRDKVKIVTTGCFGFCEKGPIVKVMPENIFYIEVNEEKARKIFQEHILGGKVVEDCLYKDPATHQHLDKQSDLPFYKKQIRIALRNCGLINPEDIHEYIAVQGYQALGKALFEMSPESVIDAVKRSGLRGRGGGGFPTGVKWEMTRKSENKVKYVICNADEGDPGAFMDRSILEGDPHSVIESMMLTGYCIGSSQGFIYIRAEYPLAIQRLRIAIKQAYDLGLLGKNILGSDFSFDIKLKYGAGAFICGEETALINSIEGGRGEPTVKPPFPSQVGLWKRPTNINNVETLANIPPILLKGAEWFSSIGTEKSKGTKVFALAGKINNVGLVEVPMGITLREIIYDLGGGIVNNRKFKAVQTGGPSGGCIPADSLDTPIDYESLGDIGSMMGSGGMIVMDEDDCMVNIAKFYLEFSVDESCGKCTACRVGNQRMLEILKDITEGKGTMEHLEGLKDLGYIIKDSSLCGLGQSSPNPILSTMKFFWDEYVAHVVDKNCPAGVCTALSKYHIDPEKCIGCTACSKACPVNAITGSLKKAHVVNKDICIKCGACESTCKFKAISRK
ncbi:NADH:ubiquinone oxidoreductase subunit F (NADH-binding)/(2Fe-2S) ferredoxin/Pyruvate/2-oxoacid:ferredoxin oxidoreductase delta subunit [Clostridium pascui]|uniref:NADH-quinone oxidoreductase subunit NuoF n=1 Tax=Clostridium pascui TaxID=46609 RepID=UPI00195D7134|nr:NADH-quinone oxidoreductase subunit NuoF [Clostridium pascui]MBM7868697.1 NADH:ubiquinone oxidoreductase subunit F (NADH-binding)/(2Fe-2S) ferredoxin/Pyruvate/2-oxoacid:ferredoxin oxidoreductase delta subunit [Clostridium pascui]